MRPLSEAEAPTRLARLRDWGGLLLYDPEGIRLRRERFLSVASHGGFLLGWDHLYDATGVGDQGPESRFSAHATWHTKRDRRLFRLDPKNGSVGFASHLGTSVCEYSGDQGLE